MTTQQQAFDLAEQFYKEINDTGFTLTGAMQFSPEHASKAIKCAIKHCELMQKELPVISVSFDTPSGREVMGVRFPANEIIDELKKMLIPCTHYNNPAY